MAFCPSSLFTALRKISCGEGFHYLGWGKMQLKRKWTDIKYKEILQEIFGVGKHPTRARSWPQSHWNEDFNCNRNGDDTDITKCNSPRDLTPNLVHFFSHQMKGCAFQQYCCTGSSVGLLNCRKSLTVGAKPFIKVSTMLLVSVACL